MTNDAELSQQEWLFKFASALHFQRLEIPLLLRAALSMMTEATSAAQGGVVIFDEQNTPRYTHLIGYHLDAAGEQDFWQTMTTRGLIGFVMHSHRVVIVRNIATDPRWAHMPGVFTSHSGSAIGIPVRAGTRLIGTVILVHGQIDYFTASVAWMVETMCDVLGAALENAAVLHETRLSEAVYRQLYERADTERSEQTRQDTLRRDLSAMIYHDLRNPLQNIQTSLSGIQRVLANSEKTVANDLINLALRSTRQITRMVKGLLDLERLEGGNAVVARRSVQITDVIGDAVELVRPIVEDAEQRLIVEIEPELPRVSMDMDMIQRVIVNLIENAAKHTPTGGKIIVSAYRKHDHGKNPDDEVREMVCVSITDTGTGIPPHVREKVFDKFFRVRYQNAPTGFGLGLAFCRLAVEAHGGRIWVESELNVGSMFAFTLPLDVQNQPSGQNTPRSAVQSRA